mmetsp:Transcript_8118/g.23976  ORF Transcript_8118/g.23976 Transcript_8118/m.23976 type:complete len:211 (+) Transcript_8118:2439-3071(+)
MRTSIVSLASVARSRVRSRSYFTLSISSRSFRSLASSSFKSLFNELARLRSCLSSLFSATSSLFSATNSKKRVSGSSSPMDAKDSCRPMLLRRPALLSLLKRSEPPSLRNASNAMSFSPFSFSSLAHLAARSVPLLSRSTWMKSFFCRSVPSSSTMFLLCFSIVSSRSPSIFVIFVFSFSFSRFSISKRRLKAPGDAALRPGTGATFGGD